MYKKEQKYGLIIVALSFMVISRGFITNAVTHFYFFEMDKTGVAKGIVNNSSITDAANGTTLVCSYSYIVNRSLYNRAEVVTVHDTILQVKQGDSILVRYNAKKPWRGTIDADGNLEFKFIAAFAVAAIACWAMTQFVIEIVRFLRCRKKDPPSGE